MINFLKEIYLTGFTLVYRFSLSKKTAIRAGGACTVISLLEWFTLLSASGYVEIFLNRKFLFHFSKAVVIAIYFAIYFINLYFLYWRGYGTRFASGFDDLKKSRRILLRVCCAAVAMAVVAFFICSAITHRRFIGVQ